MLIAWVCVLLMVIGGLIYVLAAGATKSALAELGRLTYAAGVFALAFQLARALVHLP